MCINMLCKNDMLPIHDDFHISLAKNNQLIALLKAGIDKENGDDNNLDKSLTRLAKYLKDLGYTN